VLLTQIAIMKILLTCTLFLSTLFTQAQSLDIPLITVQGSAVVFANPDEVLISVSIYKKGPNVAVAREAYLKQSKEVISFLRESGISEKHIQTQYASVGPQRKRNSTEIDHYYARQSINVCIRDLTTYDAILTELTAMDVHKIGQANFRCDDIVERRAEALRLAMKDAKQKAEMLTSEIGQSIGKAKLISEIQNKRTSFNAETYGSSVVATDGTSVGSVQGFAPGQLEIKSIVNVSFELP